MQILRISLAAGLAVTLMLSASASLWAKAHLADQPRVTASMTINAPVSWVWEMWTTKEGLEAFFGISAEVELRAQGKYQVLFTDQLPEGSRGNDDGIVLGFQTEKMLHFTWLLPPYMPEVRPHHTAVQIYFEDLGHDQSLVTIHHTGWGEGEAWDAAYEYFDSSWLNVLTALQAVAEATD